MAAIRLRCDERLTEADMSVWGECDTRCEMERWALRVQMELVHSLHGGSVDGVGGADYRIGDVGASELWTAVPTVPAGKSLKRRRVVHTTHQTLLVNRGFRVVAQRALGAAKRMRRRRPSIASSAVRQQPTVEAAAATL
jgi:hypothetical protein